MFTPTARLGRFFLGRDHVTAGCSLLDYGCGSGILAIAAARLGAGQVKGVDIDPQAVEAARANAERNQVGIEFSDSHQPVTGQYDIVVANILSNPLKALAPALASHVRPGGWLALSGILAQQAEELMAIYRTYFAMAPEKNLPQVLEAFAAIRTVRPEAKLVFVGDGPARQPLQNRHGEHVFAGMRRGEDLAAHYASGDLFLFPSVTETFGNVTLEALASGLAVVAYDYAAAAELVRPGENGLLAPPGDLPAFCQAATQAAAPETLLRLRANARESILDHDWERIHDAFAGALVRAVKSHEHPFPSSLPRTGPDGRPDPGRLRHLPIR